MKTYMEYYNTKLQLYPHAYDEGKKNKQEFKRLTLNSLKNLEMMICCWNELSKRTVDWAAIKLTIEDQLTVQRNWNLHPENLNPDMTRLKDTYWSGEENHLGNTGNVKIKVNDVTAWVRSTPVICTSVNQTPDRQL